MPKSPCRCAFRGDAMATSIAATIALASILTAPSATRPSPATTPSSSADLVASSPARSAQRDHRPRPPASRLPAERLSQKELRGARTAVAVGSAIFGVFYLGGTLAARHQPRRHQRGSPGRSRRTRPASRVSADVHPRGRAPRGISPGRQQGRHGRPGSPRCVFRASPWVR